MNGAFIVGEDTPLIETLRRIDQGNLQLAFQINMREVGPIERVSLPEELVTTVHGMMADIDLKFLAPTLLTGKGKTPAAVRLI